MELPPNPTVFKLIRWGVLLMLCVGLMKSVFGPKSPLQHPLIASANSSGSQNCDCGETNPFSNFSALAFPVIPTMAPNLQVTDTKAGKGDMAVCGQDAVVHYSLTTQNKAEIYNDLTSKDTPASFHIGAGTMLPGIERGIIGMKTGGTRTIVIPASLAFGGVSDVHALRDNAKYKFESPSDAVVATVSLESLSPAVPASDMKLRFLGGPMGNGVTAQCGNTVYADITIWKLDGSKLYSTAPDKPLPVVLGAGYAPYGIEQGLLGMREGAARTLIIPPAFTKPLGAASWDKPPPLFSFEYPNETVLAEVMLRPAPRTAR